MRNKIKKETTLRLRIFIYLTAILVPLVLLLNIYAAFMMRTFNLHIADTNALALQRYCKQLESIFSYAEMSILSFVNYKNTFVSSNTLNNELTLFNDKYSVSSGMQTLILEQRDIDALVFSGTDFDIPLVSNSKFRGVVVKEEIKTWLSDGALKALLKIKGSWKLKYFNEIPFLCRIVSLNGNTIVAMIQLSSLAEKGDYPVAFMENGEYVGNSPVVAGTTIKKPNESKPFTITAGQMLVKQPMAKTNLEAVYIIPYNGFWGGTNLWSLVLLAASLLAILLVPLTYFWVSKSIFTPVSELVGVMEIILTGKLQQRAKTDYKDKEFRVMGQTFNNMIDEANAWKIAYYEEKLEANQAKIEFMQLQIRPHFYINCLKNIYSMTHEKRYMDIQNMLVAMSDYLRYMMSQTGGKVTLRDELSTIKTYIELQGFISAYPPKYDEQIDESLLELEIPPVTLLTFVENCVKHAKTEKPLHISVKGVVANDNGKQLVILSVSDNGAGYSEDMLFTLNHKLINTKDGKHIGIYNAVSRFKLQKGAGCEIAFSNNNGAQVDIFFSLTDKEEESNEAIDC